MAEERLPIKFFAKREVDNMRIEGGGSGEPPKLVLSQAELAIKSRELVHVVENFKEEVIRKERTESIVPVIFKTKIIDDATAKTHRREVSNLFKTGADNNVLGLVEEDEVTINIATPNVFFKIDKFVKMTTSKNIY